MSLAIDASLDPPPARSPAALGYALSIAMVAGAAGLAAVVEQIAQVPNLSLVFVLPVVIAAVSFGWAPSFAAALAGVLAYNFLFLPPRFTLRVADASNIWALLLLLAIAAIVSAVAAGARRREVEARRAADRAIGLQTLARTLVAAGDARSIAAACAQALTRLFRAPAAVFIEAGETLDLAAVGDGAALSASDHEAARWALAARLPTRGGAYPASDAAYDFWPVLSARRQGAVLGVRLSGGDAGRPAEPETLVDIVAGYLSVALDRELYAREMLAARVQTAGEHLKADILAAVSHDLRTPLATIQVTLESLRLFGDEHSSQTREELLRLAERETARLATLVNELLDMNRLEAGAVVVHAEPCSPADLAVAGLARAADLPVKVVNAARPGPALSVDAALFQTALGAVLENAGKYAPAGSTVRLVSGHDDACGWIEVLDEGPGFGNQPERLFEKFARGAEGDGRPPGLGLGLSIARGFLNAMGGRLEAGDRPGGAGGWVRLSAPLADRP